MIEIVVIVVGLWLLGVIKIPWMIIPYFPVFTVFGYSLTMQRLLIIGILVWLGTSVGSPFRQMLWIFFILWLLSTLGIIVSLGMGMLIIVSVVVGLVLSVVQK